LRAKHAIPFVGTVPAIKPACAQSKTKRISVLATPGTVKRDYTRALIAEFAGDCKVDLVGSAHGSPRSRKPICLRGEAVADERIAKPRSRPHFARTERRTDTVVLACTHYPLLLARLQELAPLAGGMARSGARDRAAGREPAGADSADGPGGSRAAKRRSAGSFHEREGAYWAPHLPSPCNPKFGIAERNHELRKVDTSRFDRPGRTLYPHALPAPVAAFLIETG
jgi:hypothetical protein